MAKAAWIFMASLVLSTGYIHAMDSCALDLSGLSRPLVHEVQGAAWLVYLPYRTTLNFYDSFLEQNRSGATSPIHVNGRRKKQVIGFYDEGGRSEEIAISHFSKVIVDRVPGWAPFPPFIPTDVESVLPFLPKGTRIIFDSGFERDLTATIAPVPTRAGFKRQQVLLTYDDGSDDEVNVATLENVRVDHIPDSGE